MIIKISFASLGEFKNEWLHARYHFSFSEYHDPTRMGFSNLRVINDDTVKAGQGFGMHGHKDMEIITYVRSGAIIHQDSLGNRGITKAGDVQVMSAGSGIMHAEMAAEGEDCLLYQIWIKTSEKGLKPRWDAKTFPQKFAEGELPLLVSGREADKDKGALFIYQDAAIYGGKIEAGKTINHKISNQAYVLVSKGNVTINGQEFSERDGAQIENEDVLQIKANNGIAEILLIDIGQI